MNNKRRKIFFLLLMIFPQILFGQNGICTIKGEIKNVKGMKLIIYLMKTDRPVSIDQTIRYQLVDSLVRSNGRFLFKRNIDARKLSFYKIVTCFPSISLSAEDMPKKGTFSTGIFCASHGLITIKIESQEIVKVMGPKLTRDYEYLVDSVTAKNDKINEIYNKLSKIQQKGSFGGGILTYPDSSSIFLSYKQAFNECYAIPEDYIENNPSSLLSIVALSMMGKGNPVRSDKISRLKDLYFSLNENVRNSEPGKKYLTRWPDWKN